MKEMLLFLFLWFVLYIVGFFRSQEDEQNFEFMSRTHTNIGRAVAAIIIIWAHVAGGFGLRYFTPFGGIGVAIFLISSGYGLNESFKHKGIGGGYWKPKIIRVLVPYLIVILAVGIAILLGRDIPLPKYWYLKYILFWYLIFYIIVKIPQLYNFRYIVLGLVSTEVFIVGGIFNYDLQAEQAISFLVGVLISDNYEKTKKIITDDRLIAFFLTLGVLLLGCKQIPSVRALEDTVVWQGIQLVMKVSVAIALYGLIWRLKFLFLNCTILNIGLISYELYLVHVNILTMPSQGIAGMIRFIIITVVGASVIHYGTEIVRKKLCAKRLEMEKIHE